MYVESRDMVWMVLLQSRKRDTEVENKVTKGEVGVQNELGDWH